MCFDIAHSGRFDSGILQCLPDQPLLCKFVGHRQPAAGPIMVDRCATDQGENWVSLGQRPGEPFENDHAAPFPASKSIGGGVKGFAAAIRRQGAQFGDENIGFWGQVDLYTAGQGQLALVIAQTLHCQMDRHQ